MKKLIIFLVILCITMFAFATEKYGLSDGQLHVQQQIADAFDNSAVAFLFLELASIEGDTLAGEYVTADTLIADSISVRVINTDSLIAGLAHGDTLIFEYAEMDTVISDTIYVRVITASEEIIAEHIKSLDDIEVTDDILMLNGGIIGITGNEIITFNADGTITVSGAIFDVDGAFTATSVTSDNNVAGLTYGSDGSITDAELLTIDDGAITEVLIGGGAGLVPVWGADIPTAVTLGTKYIYRADGTDVPDADVADDISITNISQVADITASASEINTPLDGATVSLTEMQELETIGETTISVNQWAALGGMAETLTSTELDYSDGVSSSIQDQLDARCLESILGTSIGSGIILDGAVLKASIPLQSITGLTETNGGLLYGTADNTYAWLAAGTSGYILQANGAGAPTWIKDIDVEEAVIDSIISDIYMIDSTPAVDSTGSGTMSILTAGEVIDAGEVFYMKSDGEIYLADADTLITMQVLGIAVGAGTNGVACDIMTCGYFRNDAWNWTPGATLYASTTAGGISATAPVADNEVVQVLGIAITADIIYFDPERTVIELTVP